MQKNNENPVYGSTFAKGCIRFFLYSLVLCTAVFFLLVVVPYMHFENEKIKMSKIVSDALENTSQK